MSFWLKPRQIVIMDSQSSGPAKNFSARYITLFVLFIIVTMGSFVFGAWYAPFHDFQKIIPENIKLKRQTLEMQRELADMNTVNDLKDEQLGSLKEQILLQETEIVNINNQLHMYKSILDQRKGKGIHVLETKAAWNNTELSWSALFVKGGSFPRYLTGKYQLYAIDGLGHKTALNQERVRYKVESHAFLQQHFTWDEEWLPNKVELVIFNARRKEVLRKIIPIQGN